MIGGSPLRCYNSSTKVSATKVASNLNKTCCDLDLTDQKEDPLVAFMSVDRRLLQALTSSEIVDARVPSVRM